MEIIEIYATRRSGHHAFISWIITNITNQIHDFNKHLNSVEKFNDLIHINQDHYPCHNQKIKLV